MTFSEKPPLFSALDPIMSPAHRQGQASAGNVSVDAMNHKETDTDFVHPWTWRTAAPPVVLWKTDKTTFNRFVQ